MYNRKVANKVNIKLMHAFNGYKKCLKIRYYNKVKGELMSDIKLIQNTIVEITRHIFSQRIVAKKRR